MTMLAGIVRYQKGIEMNMNEFKKWFQKEKTKYYYRPINEIDCGVGWNAALKWILSCDIGPETKELIEKVFKNE